MSMSLFLTDFAFNILEPAVVVMVSGRVASPTWFVSSRCSASALRSSVLPRRSPLRILGLGLFNLLGACNFAILILVPCVIG